jgi:RNA polymerase sigma factor (sigma-70 family)
MSLNDQIDLILAAQNGDVLARNQLIESNLGFIIYVTRHVVGQRNVDSYLSDAVFGFIKAIATFRPDLVNHHVGSYFWIGIKRSIISARCAECPVPEGMCVREICEDDIIDDINPLEIEESRVAWEELSGLNEKERRVVMGFFNGETLAHIARDLGVTVQRIHQIKSRALQAVRSRLLN